MKPFRGKPEKPKRSNGEIHRQRDLYPCDARCLGLRPLCTPLLRDNWVSSTCTSPLVERRDPLGAGLRRGWSTVTSSQDVTRQTADCPVSCPTVKDWLLWYRAAVNAFRHVGRWVSVLYSDQVPCIGLGQPFVCVVLGQALTFERIYRSATLLLWVLSGPVLKHGPRSLTCTQVIGTLKPKGEMKVKVGFIVDRGRMVRVTMRTRTPGASLTHCELRRTQSVHVGTRKMVNYAWSGRSQGKPWWRSVAILTCKSIVGTGYRGERLIINSKKEKIRF